MAEKEKGVNKTPRPQNNDVVLNVVTQEPIWMSEEDKFQVPFVVVASKGNWPLKNHTIIVIEETGVNTHDTTEQGILASYVFVAKKRAGQMVTLKFNVKGYNVPKDFVITMPQVPEKEIPKKNLPAYLDLESYTDKEGRVSITATVMDVDGKGLEEEKVNLVYRGKNNYLPDTDSSGNTGVTQPIELEEGEMLIVIGKVSGITNPEVLTIPGPEAKSEETENDDNNSGGDQPSNKNKKEVKKSLSNNKKALIFIFLMFVAWIYCWNIGTGDSLINPPDTELSPAQIHYNELVSMHNPNSVIKPEVSEGNWQKGVWFFVTIFSLFTCFYTLFVAPSDEVKQIFTKWNKKRKVKTSGRTEDPLWERTMDTIMNSSDRIQKKRSKSSAVFPPVFVTNNPPADLPAAETSKWSFNSLKSNIVVQLILELIAEIAAHKLISKKIK